MAATADAVENLAFQEVPEPRNRSAEMLMGEADSTSLRTMAGHLNRGKPEPRMTDSLCPHPLCDLAEPISSYSVSKFPQAESVTEGEVLDRVSGH